MPQHYCGDSTRLRQALLNFIGNAVKFTAQGSVMLAGRVMEEDQESYLLRFEVTDTGSGMTEAQQANLFKPFVQADGSITRKYGGTGLGLVISKNIAELMGGEVGVESHLGEGSTFWMTVRLEKGVEQAVEVIQQRSEAVELELRQKHAGARILLAEDEPINREVALELLRDVGMTACVAEDGREAVEYLERQVFDLVLMDMQMPNLDGLGATAKIRQLPNGLLVPIVAMTANAFSEDRQRCLAAGMNDFLTKPVDPDVLFATLLKWLASAPANASRESSVH
jgi:CheY-like chemotaxis protein